MPLMVDSASSMGRTTWVVISSGVAPGRLTLMLTVAGSARGKRSTPRSRNEKRPEDDQERDEHDREHGPLDAQLGQGHLSQGGTRLISGVAVGSPPETPRRATPPLRGAAALTGWLVCRLLRRRDGAGAAMARIARII